jgi:peptidoglycan/LPS O-acetylase OafA/YrhL
VSLPHVRALDGLRGIAIVGVLLFHGGHLVGGYLGVDLFFVLSGFLITSLLLAEWDQTHRISLGGFWARRARRLLPALALVLLGVAVYCVVFADPTELGRIRGDALATIAYVANWRAIYAGQSYFELFTSPSPLQHTWSLAIEEQFYLLWPLLFVGIAHFAKRRTPQAVLATALTLGAASAITMVLIHDPTNLNRAYYGTDTRAYALFAGIAIAGAVKIWGHAKDPLLRVGVEAAAIISIVVLAVMWTRVDAQTERLYVGGFAIAGAAAALVCLAIANPRRGPVAWLFSFPPLCWLGLISYGLYLWHWPVDIVLNPDRTGITGWPLFLLQTAVAITIATASYKLVELPIRRGTLELRRPLVLVPAIASALVAIIVLTTLNATTPPTASADVTRPLAHNDVAVVGDSLANSLYPGVQRAGVKANLWWSAGCRLIHGGLPYHPDYDQSCPWESDFRQVISYYQPRRVVLFMGIWDMFVVQPKGSDAQLTPGDPAWNALFARQMRTALRLLEAGGARVTVLTLPCTALMGTVSFKDVGSFDLRRVVAANRVIKQVVAQDPRAEVADTFARLCPGGRYSANVDGVATRKDGVHLSDAGADLVGRWLATTFKLRTAG